MNNISDNDYHLWFKPAWPQSQRRFLIWMIPLLLVLFIGAVILWSISKKYERLDSMVVTSDYSEGVAIEWPKGVHYDGIGKVDDCVVVYSKKGYFAIFEKNKLERMIYTGGTQNGIYHFQIFSIHSDGLVYLYSSTGKLVRTVATVALTESVKKQLQEHKQEQVINGITYKIQRTKGTERVIVQSGDASQTLIEKEYMNTKAIRVVGDAFAIIGFFIIVLYFIMNIPAYISFLKRIIAKHGNTLSRLSGGRFC